MADFVDADAVVFALETVSGSTPSLTVGSANRLFFSACGSANAFGGAPTISSHKYGGSGGTDITAADANTSFYFGNGVMQGGYALPGPSSASDAYMAASAGLQAGVAAMSYEGVASVADFTSNSGAEGDVDTTVGQLVVANAVTGNKVIAILEATSGSLTLSAFTPVTGTTIRAQATGEFTGFVCLEKTADADGDCTLQVNCNHTTTGSLSFAVKGMRLIDASGGSTYDVDAAQAVDVGDSATSQTVVTGEASAAVDVSDSSTSQMVMGGEAAATIDVSDAATSQAVMAADAAAAVDVDDAATSSTTMLTAATEAVDVSDSATSAAVFASDASAAVDLADSASALAAGDLLGEAAVDLSDTASSTATQAVDGSAAIDVSDAADSQAVLLAEAAAAIDLGDSAESAMAGGNVYDVDATDGIDLSDAASSAASGSGDIAELEEKIDALTALVVQLSQDVATARTFYTGGPDYDDVERRDLLRHYDKKIDIQEQNAMLLKMFKAIVTQESTP